MPQQANFDIPSDLSNQIKELRTALRRRKTFELSISICIGLLAGYLLVAGMDRVFSSIESTPKWIRFAVLICSVGVSVLGIPYVIKRWFLGFHNPKQMAHLVSKAHPRLGDRLLGILELADQPVEQGGMSKQLAEAAILQVAKESSQRNLNEAVPVSINRPWFIALACMSVAVLLYFILAPSFALNSLARFWMPHKDIERIAFASLEPLQEEIFVARGEDFSLSARLHPQSNWFPSTAEAKLSTGLEKKTSLEDKLYPFHFAGISQAVNLAVQAGDASRTTRITPLVRPLLSSIQATIYYPEILQREAEQIDLRSGIIKVVEGSEVLLEGKLNRELATGVIEELLFLLPGQEASTEVTHQARTGELTPKQGQEKQFTSPRWLVANGKWQWQLRWQDIANLSQASPYTVVVESVEDQAPSISLSAKNGTQFQSILPSEHIELHITANDDYGIKDVGIEYIGEPGSTEAGVEPVEIETTEAYGSPTQVRVNHALVFHPESLNISPQAVQIRAWTKDYRSDEKVYSQPLLVYVLTDAQAELILEHANRQLMGELENIGARIQNELEETELLQNSEQGELTTEEGSEEVDKNARATSTTEEDIQQAAENAKKLVEDGLRLENLNPEVMQNLLTTADMLEEMAQNTAPQASQAYNQASQSSASGAEQRQAGQQNQADQKEAETREHLETARQKQEEMLNNIEKSIQQTQDNEELLRQGGFAHRLTEGARLLRQLAHAAAATLSTHQIAGVEVEKIEVSDANDLILQHSRTQKELTQLSQHLRQDIEAFATRMENPAFAQIAQQMNQEGVIPSLEKNTKRFENNLTGSAINEAVYWSERFDAWSKHLKEQQEGSNGGGGGGGGGGGDEKPDPEKFEIMLQLMRMLQLEMDIESRTRDLNPTRPTESLPSES